jgi:hypothetical protein
MPLHFLPFGLSPRALKIFSRRATCSFVCSKCPSKPARKSPEVEALAILGRAFTSWFSAL